MKQSTVKLKVQDYVAGSNPTKLQAFRKRFDSLHYRNEFCIFKEKYQGGVLLFKTEYEEKLKRINFFEMKKTPSKDMMRSLAIGTSENEPINDLKLFTDCETKTNEQLDETLYKSLVARDHNSQLSDAHCSLISMSPPRVQFVRDTTSSLNESDLNTNISVHINEELESCLKNLETDSVALLAISENRQTCLSSIESNINENIKKPSRELEERIYQEVKDSKLSLFGKENHGLKAEERDEEYNLMQKRTKAKLVLRESEHLLSIEDYDSLQEEAFRKKEELKQENMDSHHQIVIGHEKQIEELHRLIEEQAIERKQERDEFVRQINSLKNILEEKETIKDCITREADPLEKQLTEKKSSLEEGTEKLQETEAELKVTVDKTRSLKEIIKNLEKHLATIQAEKAISYCQKFSNLCWIFVIIVLCLLAFLSPTNRPKLQITHYQPKVGPFMLLTSILPSNTTYPRLDLSCYPPDLASSPTCPGYRPSYYPLDLAPHSTTQRYLLLYYPKKPAQSYNQPQTKFLIPVNLKNTALLKETSIPFGICISSTIVAGVVGVVAVVFGKMA